MFKQQNKGAFFVEERWKLSDEELFSGIPQNGRTAWPRKGDLADVVNSEIHTYIENYNRSVDNWNEYRLEHGKDLPSDSWKFIPPKTSEIPKKLTYSIDRRIDRALNDAEGPFYIGSLPSAKKEKIASDIDDKPLYLNYFCEDYSVPYIDSAKESIAVLRNYLRTPFSELKQLFLRLLLVAVSILQLVLAVNENINYQGFLMVPGLPLFYPDVGVDFLFWHGLAWFAAGLPVVWAAYSIEEYYHQPLGDFGTFLCFGHFVMAAAHGICALRMILVSVAVSGLLIVFMLIFLGMYIWAFMKLIPAFFKHMRRKKNIPKDYSPDFVENAAYCYRYCRLRILWYENATGKRAPSRFYSTIRTLDRLDKKYRKMIRKFNKLTQKAA